MGIPSVSDPLDKMARLIPWQNATRALANRESIFFGAGAKMLWLSALA
jgi:hypothetical protein